MTSCSTNFVFAIVAVLAIFSHGEGKEEDSDEKPARKSVEIVYLHALSTIQARFATTTITSQLANRADSSKEVTFTAQLPDSAFISNFSMQIDDKVIYGEVKEKEEAKEAFEAAKARGESTGLVAKAPRETNSFTITVNIAAESKIRFNLTYQEVLKRVHGVYKHVINLQQDLPVSDLKVDVFITEKGEIKNLKVPRYGEKAGEKTNKELLALDAEPNVEIKPILKSSDINSVHIQFQPKGRTKEVGNGQLVVLYDVQREKSGGEIEVVNGYFVHFFAPEGLKKRPKDILFVLDKSGSMQGRKITQLKDAMKVILNDLNEEDTFQILLFSDEVEHWREKASKATSENVKAAVTFVQDTEADGGTNIYDSLQEGLKSLKRSSAANVPVILFLTDGQPTVGETDLDKIITDTSKANGEAKTIIHSIAFGEDADYDLVKKISARNRGLARRVYEDSDAELQLEGFYEEISSPVLTELKIDYLSETVDASSVIQDSSPSFYDGSEVVVVGKVKGGDKTKDETTEIRAKVSGEGAAGNAVLETHSLRPLYCPVPYPPYPIYWEDGIAIQPRDRVEHWPDVWCCPPPYCCWWRHCHPPPPPPPPPTKAPLPARTVGGFIERMWAYQTIKKLLRDVDLKDTRSEREDAKAKALELSLKYHFVTELTSMVVVKPNDETPAVLRPEEKEKGKAESAGGSNGAPVGAAGFVGGGGGAGFGRGIAAGPVAPSSSHGAVDLGAVDESASNGGGGGELARPVHVAPAPAPPPPPPPSRGKDRATTSPPAAPTDKKKPTQSREKNKEKATTRASPKACRMEVVFVREVQPSDHVDRRVGDYAMEAIKTINSSNAIAKIGLAVVLSGGRGFVWHDMDTPGGVVVGSNPLKDKAAVKTSLVQTIDHLFRNYTTNGVKRYIVFLVESTPPQYAVDASSRTRSHGVSAYAVCFASDKSNGFVKTLESITGDKNRVLFSPPSTGKELADALVKCA